MDEVGQGKKDGELRGDNTLIIKYFQLLYSELKEPYSGVNSVLLQSPRSSLQRPPLHR
jgi:hypothetical protein